ncbi:putative P-type Ca(2+) transporter [Helianthus annuus]|nr:putative P-type Ca(2+) transporter [Helianthus annuus]
MTNDTSTLEEADIGLSIEIQETEVANQSSDSVFSDEDIASLSTVVMLGRYNNIQKFIQFQLTVNVATLVINFMTVATSGGAPLTTVQLLRVNLIMDTLGAVVLATEGPTKEILSKPPVGLVKQIIMYIMSRHLFAHAVFQIIVLLTFEFKVEAIFNVEEKVKNIITFNTFVLCQVFNEFNSRKLQKRNIFKGIHKRKLFVGITGITIIFEIVMVIFLENLWNRRRSNGVQWGITIAIATLSWSSLKEDAQNSVNDFLTTTVKPLKKMVERLRVSDELVKPLADLALIKTRCFDPHALETLEQVINAFETVIEKQNDAAKALEAYTTLADTFRSSQPDPKWNMIEIM